MHLPAWPRYSVLVNIGSALLWDITQPRELIPYRRFDTTYRCHLQGPRKLRYTTPRSITTQKSSDLIKIAAEE